MALALELGHDDLVDVEEAVLLEADLDERGLHARQHVVDDAEVDVAGDRAALGPLEVDLGDAVVLEDGDALLADVDRDQQLALGGRQRRAARRLAAASALAAGAALAALAACLLGLGDALASRAGSAGGLRLVGRASAVARSPSPLRGRPGFLRPRPPRLPRRRFGLAASPSAPLVGACSGASSCGRAGSAGRVLLRRAVGACVACPRVVFPCRRNQGKRTSPSCSARATAPPQAARRVACSGMAKSVGIGLTEG